MSAPAAPLAATPTHEAPTSQTVLPGESGTADLLAAAIELCRRGWGEHAAMAALETWRAQGARWNARRVFRMTSATSARLRAQFAREARRHRPGRRGDIIFLRSDPAWPWRTSTAREF